MDKKTIIEILHWTPLGLITVPVYKIPKIGPTDNFRWLTWNGIAMGTYIGTAIALILFYG